jgi:hypothetical protein
MNASTPDRSSSSPRRLFLVAAESVAGAGRRPRIRRYQLARVGRTDDERGAGAAAAWMSRGVGGGERM